MKALQLILINLIVIFLLACVVVVPTNSLAGPLGLVILIVLLAIDGVAIRDARRSA